MTKEEREDAIKFFKEVAKREVNNAKYSRLAIEALEQEPCEDWYDVPSDEMTLEQAKQAVKDLREKLAEYLEQQPCEDVISRDCDKCAYYDDGANHEACDECFADEYEHPNFKPKAQHCDDCISRQEAINCVTLNEFRYKIVEDIKTLPSVTPFPKRHGKLTNPEWIGFLSEQFDISRTSAKKMLHAMMSVKKEDNFKKQFSQGNKGFSQGFSQSRK